MKSRVLNKVVFINVANSEYSVAEIAGNTCFVGTNNLGKTTLQRAILFFYNANTRWLGISSSQKPFEDYYFPYPNSHIIYEIGTGDSAFHVWVYRTNKVNFRFIDTPFQPELYIHEQQALMPKEVVQRLQQMNIEYSDQIDTFERYRNIIYGADPDKKYKKFFLLKGNSQYHNIPLAITSIFLSSDSSIKAEFVKDCIANAIQVKNSTIELRTVERQLRLFAERYADIEAYFKKENQQRGEFIRDNFQQIRQLKSEQKQLGTELGSALKYAEGQSASLRQQIIQLEEALQLLQQEIQEREQAFEVETRSHYESIGVCKTKIKEAEKRLKAYDEEKIIRLMEQSERKPMLLAELEARKKEYELLNAQLSDAGLFFEKRYEQLEGEKKEVLLQQKEQLLKISSQRKEEEERLKEQEAQVIAQTREFYESKELSLKESLLELEYALKEKTFEEKEIKSQVFFESELRSLQKQIAQHQEQANIKKGRLDLLDAEMENLKHKRELLQEKLNVQSELQLKEIESEIQQKENRIAQLDSYIQQHKGSLVQFLEKEFPDWQESIGKIIREDLLYAKDLKPVKSTKGNQGLYGVELNLASIKSKVQSPEQFEKEREQLSESLQGLRHQLLDLREEASREEQAKLGALGKKAGELKNEQSRLVYELEQEGLKSKELELEIGEWKHKAQEEREKLLVRLLEEKNQLSQRVQLTRNTLSEWQQERKQKLELLESEWYERLKALRDTWQQKKNTIEELYKTKLLDLDQKKSVLDEEKSGKLKKQKVNPEVLKNLQEQFISLQEQLTEIDSYADLLNRYKIDKEEYFDTLPATKEELKRLENELKFQQENSKEEKQAFAKRRKQIESERSDMAATLKELSDGLHHYDHYFKERTVYERLRPLIEQAEAGISAYTITDLCARIMNNDQEFHKQYELFKRYVTDYIGHFRNDNHFNFKVPVQAHESDYEHFANTLQEFHDENKIQTSIAEVAKSYSMLIDTIATKVKALTDHKGKVQKIIEKMEHDFSKATFEKSKLIEYIKLKSEDSENKILKRLMKITDFREKHSFMYGEVSLFNSDQKTKNDIDRKAVDMLYELLKVIHEENKEEIRVQDLFELKFRIKEGKNDTGWIDKIDRVGSTGTDMLVKAVIYITLLHVFIKESTDRSQYDFHVHCVIDEVGQISANYLKELIEFSAARNIFLINGLPNESKLESNYNYTYKFRKDQKGSVSVIPLLTMSVEP
ncbi:MAG: ATP-binding protein [Cytophagaceae bacterium]|jgi:hypothetical protein|nr:ATP-binding protein [Cytophagaceae bacterium]